MHSPLISLAGINNLKNCGKIFQSSNRTLIHLTSTEHFTLILLGLIMPWENGSVRMFLHHIYCIPDFCSCITSTFSSLKSVIMCFSNAHNLAFNVLLFLFTVLLPEITSLFFSAKWWHSLNVRPLVFFSVLNINKWKFYPLVIFGRGRKLKAPQAEFTSLHLPHRWVSYWPQCDQWICWGAPNTTSIWFKGILPP